MEAKLFTELRRRERRMIRVSRENLAVRLANMWLAAVTTEQRENVRKELWRAGPPHQVAYVAALAATGIAATSHESAAWFAAFLKPAKK